MKKVFVGIVCLMTMQISLGSADYERQCELLQQRYQRSLKELIKYEKYMQCDDALNSEKEKIQRCMLYSSEEISERYASLSTVITSYKINLLQFDTWFKQLGKFEYEYVEDCLKEFEFDLRSVERQLKILSKKVTV